MCAANRIARTGVPRHAIEPSPALEQSRRPRRQDVRDQCRHQHPGHNGHKRRRELRGPISSARQLRDERAQEIADARKDQLLNAFNQTGLGAVYTNPASSAFGSKTSENSAGGLMGLDPKVKFQ